MVCFSNIHLAIWSIAIWAICSTAQDDPTYDCGDGNVFTQEDAYTWSEDYIGDDRYGTTPCEILFADSTFSSDIDAVDDPVADGSWTETVYDTVADIPDLSGLAVARRAPTGILGRSARLASRQADGKVHCIDVQAKSRTIYVAASDPPYENGHLGLHVNVCFQNGQIIIDKTKGTPFVETRPIVNDKTTLLGFQWDFSQVTPTGSIPGVTQGCENNCGQYRVTFQGRLIEKASGSAGGKLDIGGGKQGVDVGGSINVDRPGDPAAITIVVRASDGATFCAPSQLGYTGTFTCLNRGD